MLHCQSFSLRRRLIEHQENEHGDGRDSQFVRFGTSWRVHLHDGFTQGEAYRYLASLMLIRIESLELLKLIVDLGRHLQVDHLEGGPVARLEALDVEVELRVGHQFCVWTAFEVCQEFFGFLLNGEVVREHALHLIHLLHATRDL